MDKLILEISNKRRRKKLLRRVTALLCAVVLLCTVIALERPVAALETPLLCGFEEEHTHNAACYAGDALICGLEEHVHTEECHKELSEARVVSKPAEAEVDEFEGELAELVPEIGEAPAEETEGEETSEEPEDVKTAKEETASEEIPEEEAVPEEEETPEGTEDGAAPEIAYPAQDFEGRSDFVKVAVSAPEGAFPEGTAMTVADVEDSATLNNIEATVSEDFVEVRRVHAVDITFRDADGREIEPLAPISVAMTVDGIGQRQDAVVVHVDDAGEAEVVDSRSEAPAGETEVTVEMPATEAPAASRSTASCTPWISTMEAIPGTWTAAGRRV